MTMPTVTIEIGFDYSGSRQSIATTYSSVVWTDVTAYVLVKQGVKFNRGRAETGMAAAAGQLMVTFDNSDGRFTPGTTGGAYGRVRTRMPIRVKAGSTVLWVGFVTDIDWQMRSGQPEVTIVAADIIATAARTKCGPWLTKRVLAKTSGLINYWPLTDTAPNSVVGNTNTAVEVVLGDTARAAYGASDLTVAGAGGMNAYLAFNVVSDVSPDPSAEPVFGFAPVQVVNYGKHLYAPTTLDATGDLAVSLWVRPFGVDSRTIMAVKRTGTGATAFALHTQADGTLRVAADYFTGAAVTFGALADETWSHLYLQRDNSETAPASRFRMWVNGVERTGTATSTMTTDATTSVTVNVGGDDAITSMGDYIGAMGHVALWNTLDTSRAVFLSNTGGAGATTCADRIGELHYLTPNPAGLSSWIDTTTQADNTVSPQAANSKSLLQVAEEVADAERGSIIATRTGKMKLLAQRYSIAPADVSVTLSAETDILSLANTFGVDDTAAINECVITLQPSGWRYTAARIFDSGVESTTLDVWSADQYFAVSLATQIANANTEQPRAPSLALSMEWLNNVGFDDEVLGLELGDSIRVTDLPSQAPATSLTLQVRLIEHNITANGWQVRIDTDPPIYGAVLNDPDLGILDGTTFLGV